MKWIISLILLTFIFIITSFFIPNYLLFPFRWMTVGMAFNSFIFYFMVNKSKANNAYSSLAAIVVKFILSGAIVIIYFIITESKNKIDYYKRALSDIIVKEKDVAIKQKAQEYLISYIQFENKLKDTAQFAIHAKNRSCYANFCNRYATKLFPHVP